MKSPLWIISRLGFLAAIWGSSFILMKRGLFDSAGAPIFSGYQVGFLRIALAALTLLPFALKAYKRIKKDEWVPLVIAGLIGNGFPAILFALAQTKIASSLAGVLNSLTPFFTLIIGLLFFNVIGSAKKYWGVALGMIGAVGLILSQADFHFQFKDVGGYSLLVVAACLCYATSVNIIKFRLKNVRPLDITAISFSFLCIPFIAGAWLTGAGDVLKTNPNALSALGYIAILGIVGTALAVILFNVVIKETSALTASSVTYLIPIVAVLWGLLDGESFGWIDLGFFISIISGVYLVNAKKT